MSERTTGEAAELNQTPRTTSTSTGVRGTGASSSRVTSRVRVRYAETDRMGVAYYANYLVWFEVGRCEWLREKRCTYRELEEAGIVLPVIEAGCEYRRPIMYDDEVEIRTDGELLSPARVRFRYEVVDRRSGAIAAAGYTVHASIDARGRPCRLPEHVRQLFP